MNNTIMVTKADGTKEPFDESKVRTSLKEAGADKEAVDEITEHIKNELRPGIKTSSIYKHAFSQLKRRGGSYAARYSLRRALSDLGPTGYPFEHFVAQLFEAQGFNTEVGVMLEGECTNHEVDVVGEKEDEFIIAEAKFHNKHNIKSDVKTALYVNARFEDLEKTQFDALNTGEKSVRCLLVTNTKFTTNATDYGKCSGLELVGWGYPKKENLEYLIHEATLEPITALTTLNKKHKKHLLDEELVLCKDLRENRAALKEAGLSEEEIEQVMNEVDGLCHF